MHPNASKYGLNGSHHILLEGFTYPSERRSAMAQSMGPMTTLYLHVRTGKNGQMLLREP